jgi:gliding motility-associated protein GldM
MLQEGQEGEWLYDAGDGFLAIKDLVVHEYDRKDDYDIPTRLFVGDNHKVINEKGIELITKIENYRDSISIMIAKYQDEPNQKTYSFVPPKISKENQTDTAYLVDLEKALETVSDKHKQPIRDIYRLLTMPKMVENHGEMYPWQAGQFDHAPMAAASAIFTSLKSRVLQAEKIVLNSLNENSEAPLMNFNKIESLAFSNTRYINKGDSLDLSVMIAAYDTTSNNQIRYWIDDTLRNPENMLVSDLNALKLSGKIGNHLIVGDIAVQTKNGLEWKPWKFDFAVGAPNAAISSYDNNVLYVGWKNRIKIAAGGFPPEKVKVACKNCTVTKEGEFYIVNVSTISSKPEISVSAEDENGNIVPLTKELFRVMPLPLPSILVGGNGPDKTSMTQSQANSLLGIATKIESTLDISYSIESFDLIVSVGGTPKTLSSSSAAMTEEMKKALKEQKKGAYISINNVKVKGPNGKVSIPGATYKLN